MRPMAAHHVRWDVSIGGMASHRLVHRGINRTFQIPKPFLSLTVRENVEVALAYGGRRRGGATDLR